MKVFKPKDREKVKREIREFTSNIQMDGAFRKTEEGEIHWRSEKTEDCARFHIRAKNFKGGIRWFAGIEMFGDLETFYIQQKEEEGCTSLSDAITSARNRLRYTATVLSTYSNWF